MNKTKSTKPKTAISTAQAYLKSHRFDGLSIHHIRTVRKHVGIFVGHFKETPLENITPEEVLRSMPKNWGQTSKANYIRAIKTFATWARDNDYLPYERRTFAERIRKPKEIPQDPEFFTTEEMRCLLRVSSMLVGGIDEFLLSILILGGFVGLRSSEIGRLKWTDIDLTHRAVRLTPKITKTSSRRIALIPENAAAWLEHIKDKSGFVVPQQLIPNINRHIGNLAKESGVEWKNNALRHSYVTYAMAVERDAWKVAEQVGNSPRVLQAHYKGLVLLPDAVEWFGITPDNTL
jgi:integrase